MKKEDIAVEIDRLRKMREETPAPAATPGAGPRKSKAAIESVKEAKAHEFPVAPAPKGEKTRSAIAQAKAAAVPKKKSRMDRLLELAATMSDTEEE
jgi:hypothetical protein